ncbi:hypothetical protein GJAV_G00276210 [Gymnothorax javanicus]|nr:hypothetical protein GJAV_G00276210 [Gymnothorax javanicus]
MAVCVSICVLGSHLSVRVFLIWMRERVGVQMFRYVCMCVYVCARAHASALPHSCSYCALPLILSPPEQAGGDDQRAGGCHDGGKARAGVHGGSGEDTQSDQRQHKQQGGTLVIL